MAIISTLPNIIKVINVILVKLFRSKKLKFFMPYSSDAVVFVNVSIDNLKESSKFRLSKVKTLDSTNIAIINDINIKKVILTSSSFI